jgi:peroxiredoxin Q/BCP
VSKDSVKAHDKFCKKHGLQIILASDEGGTTCEDYGVWVEKSMYGKTYMGIERSTVLIDGAGRVARIWPKVSVKGHADEVLAAAQAL